MANIKELECSKKYDVGGTLTDSTGIDTSRVAALARRINETSNADFVKRLLDENRRVLRNGEGSVSTHELGYADDGRGDAVVFPQVQSSDYGNLLMRVPHPLSYYRAVRRGDTVHMSTPDAEQFTRGYKIAYPSSDKYACGGLLRKYQDGGNSGARAVLPEVVVTPHGNYVNYTGEETTVPSISDFFEAKANAARVHAVGNILNTEHPVVPAVPNALARNLLVRFGVSDETAAGLLGYDRHPHTCIATTTAQYNDPEAFVPGNITFDKNRTGFVQVGDYDYSPGDLVNLYYTGIPFHSTMVTGVTGSLLGSEYGSPILTYSNGGIDVPGEETHMRYNLNNLYDDGDDETPDFDVMPGNIGDTQYKVFRYVGSPSRKIDWGREYNSKYGYAVDEKGNAVEPRDKMYGLLAKMQQYGYKFEKTSDGKLKVVRK